MKVWCRDRNTEPGGLLSLAPAWSLAETWYHDRLEPSWQRKTLEEAQGLFTELGLVSQFWQLSAQDGRSDE